MMLWARQVNKVFSPRVFISKKMVTNLKLDFRNVPFRQNPACVVIRNWLYLYIYIINNSYLNSDLRKKIILN